MFGFIVTTLEPIICYNFFGVRLQSSFNCYCTLNETDLIANLVVLVYNIFYLLNLILYTRRIILVWFTIWHYKSQIISFLDIIHCTAVVSATFNLKRVVLEYEDVIGSTTVGLRGTSVVLGGKSFNDIGYHYATSKYILITYTHME